MLKSELVQLLARKQPRGDVLLVMLGGGDKSTQASDIAKAQKLASTLE